MKTVAIIGGGVAGMAAAKILVDAGLKVTLYERLGRLGGLARTFKIADTRLECFYHHIFKSDTAIVGLIEELGIGDKLIWNHSPMGFFVDGQIYDFGGPMDLLKFKPLSFIDRIKFGASALYFQKKKDWRSLEEMTVKEWVEKYNSPAVYKKVWEPLLRLKFGPDYEETTAAWLWGRIHPRSQSRSSGGAKEVLGYMEGSFETFLQTLADYLKNKGVEIRTGQGITDLRKETDGFKVSVNENTDSYDAVLFTAPNETLCQVTQELPAQYREKLLSVRYQGVITFICELTKSLSHIYWLNISDPKVNFGGVIEQTNFIEPKSYNGSHVVYFFNYLQNDHPYYKLSRDELLEEYLPAIKHMFPSFEKTMIKKSYLFQTSQATPVYVGRYSEKIPPHETPLDGMFLASMSQVYPDDRNMNNSIKQGQIAARKLIDWIK